MLKQELIDYIKNCEGQGIPKEEVKKTLRSVGWAEADIEEGFRVGVPRTPQGTDVAPNKLTAQSNQFNTPQINALQTQKKSGNLVITIATIIFVVTAGALVYYFWFF